MDPNATLSAMVEALAEFDATANSDALADVKEHAGNLRGWITRGGFLPEIDREQLATILKFLSE